LEELGAKGPEFGLGKFSGLSWTAVAQPDNSLKKGIIFNALLLKQFFNQIQREWRKRHYLAARTNRGQLPIGATANENKHRSRRRLFQGFEKTIGRLFTQIISVIENGNLALATRGLKGEIST
jgi:hypothetical protein